jgi:RNA polymerase sigma factor (sigma-70 family)
VQPREELVGRAAAGDREALAELIARHGPSVRGGLSIPARWSALLTSEDVLQDAYAEALLHVGELAARSEEGFRAWLTAIAQNKLRDALRLLDADKRGGGRRAAEPASREESFSALGGQIEATTTTPSRHLARREMRPALERALERLPEAQSRAVRLYDLEGRAVGEVAAELGRSPGAVLMLRARAHRRLAELLEPDIGPASGA